MVALQQPFNVQSVVPSSGPPLIPEGWYPAHMVASDLKPTAANDGGFIECVYEINDGPYRGTKQYDRLNIYNKSQTAVEIAYGTLSAIGWCCGVFNIQDTSQLHNIPLMIQVVQAKNERDGGMANKIKGYKDRNGQEPWKAQGGGMGSQPQQQPQQQPQWGQPQQQPQQQPQPPQQQPQQQPQPGGWQPSPNGGAPQPAPWAGGGQPPQQPQQAPQQAPQQPQQPSYGAPAGGGAPAAPWQQGGGSPGGGQPTPPWQQR